jgi:hypothetical protein
MRFIKLSIWLHWYATLAPYGSIIVHLSITSIACSYFPRYSKSFYCNLLLNKPFLTFDLRWILVNLCISIWIIGLPDVLSRAFFLTYFDFSLILSIVISFHELILRWVLHQVLRGRVSDALSSFASFRTRFRMISWRSPGFLEFLLIVRRYKHLRILLLVLWKQIFAIRGVGVVSVFIPFWLFVF